MNRDTEISYKVSLLLYFFSTTISKNDNDLLMKLCNSFVRLIIYKYENV